MTMAVEVVKRVVLNNYDAEDRQVNPFSGSLSRQPPRRR